LFEEPCLIVVIYVPFIRVSHVVVELSFVFDASQTVAIRFEFAQKMPIVHTKAILSIRGSTNRSRRMYSYVVLLFLNSCFPFASRILLLVKLSIVIASATFAMAITVDCC